jgi:hypothetical protein
MMNKKQILVEYLNLILMLNFVLHRFWGLCFVILMTVFVTQMGSCLVRGSHALEEDYLKKKRFLICHIYPWGFLTDHNFYPRP